MNRSAAAKEPIAGVRSAEAAEHRPTGPVARLVNAITPDLRPDPRSALRDMRVTEPLRALLRDPDRAGGLTLEDDSCDDPYADSSGNTPKRFFSVLRSENDHAVLLQVPDWLANDAANIGALDEIRDVFTNRKVRILAEQVQSPHLSLEKTLPRVWRDRASIDVDFVSWRYVIELLEGRQSPAAVFGLGTAAPKERPAASDPKRVKRVFIGSTARDLTDYRDKARDVCLELDFMPTMMEYFEAMGQGATKGSLMKVDQADIYVGIFAYRYGFIEPGQSASVSELEFEHAGKRGIPRLCFVVDRRHPWPTDSWDPEHQAQMESLKRSIAKLIRGEFTTADDFARKLSHALVPHRP
jgi:hypothetical protein